MAYGYTETVALFALILLLLYYYLVSTFGFWKKQGVNGPKPIPIYGTIKNVVTGKISVGIYLKSIYDKFVDEPFIGFFMMREPVLLIRDLDVVKDVLIKDFTVFSDRHINVYEKTEPFSVHLFRLETARWRPLRSRLSPVFTSGKLKEMFHLLLDCADQVETYLDELIAKSPIVECKELTAKYTTEVIGSCAFGIEMNSINNEATEFRRMGKKIFHPSFKGFIRDRLSESAPWLYEHFGSWIQDDDITKFFTRITKEMIQYRKENNVQRHDFVEKLIDLYDNPEQLGIDKLTDHYLTAQAFVFFAAGHETSSMTITYAMYELAMNKAIQDKLREEINTLYENTDGKIQYNDINEMKYLDMFYKEVLRKYPAVLYLSRRAMANYTFDNTKISIPKRHKVFIPVYAIHHDPNIYPNPEILDPYRFSEENIKSRHPMSYLPFGNGPRNCIGARFATYQTKLGIIKIVHKHQLDICEKTQIPVKMNPRPLFLLQPLDGTVYLKVTKIGETIL